MTDFLNITLDENHIFPGEEESNSYINPISPNEHPRSLDVSIFLRDEEINSSLSDTSQTASNMEDTENNGCQPTREDINYATKDKVKIIENPIPQNENKIFHIRKVKKGRIPKNLKAQGSTGRHNKGGKSNVLNRLTTNPTKFFLHTFKNTLNYEVEKYKLPPQFFCFQITKAGIDAKHQGIDEAIERCETKLKDYFTKIGPINTTIIQRILSNDQLSESKRFLELTFGKAMKIFTGDNTYDFDPWLAEEFNFDSFIRNLEEEVYDEFKEKKAKNIIEKYKNVAKNYETVVYGRLNETRRYFKTKN